MPADSFMIRAHVPHWEACVADRDAASEATRRSHPERRTVVYGETPEEKLDLYFPAVRDPGAALPIHLFVHGGYWRAYSKDDYAFVADAITTAGAVAAIVDYALMPAARMDQLVGQVRRAAQWLADNAGSFGGDPGRLSASGHSAGAHLSSFLVARGDHERDVRLPPMRAVLLVSGIYDLEPITRSFLQPEIALTAEEVLRWSPLRARFVPGPAVDLLVGEKETPPFHEQAAALEKHLARQGARSSFEIAPGEDHMTIVRELGRPGSACAQFLAQTIAAAGPQA